MKRREFIKTLGLSAASIGLLSCGAFTKNKKQPNIILFLVDDMGWQDTSVEFFKKRTEFNNRYLTPNMERLEKQGMKFTQAYACCVCSPTRISLMTGMNAAHHRVTNWTLRKNASNDGKDNKLEFPLWNVNGMSMEPGIERTVYAPKPLPALLNKAGYKTIHVGKAHFGAIGTPAENPENIGFDVNIAGHAAGGLGSYLGIHNFSAQWRGGGKTWDVPGMEKYHGKDIFLTEALTLEAINAVDQTLKEKRPFFLYMSHYAVHSPIEKDKRFIQKYLDAGLNPTEAKYASMIEAMDMSLGDLMNFIEDKGEADNTIILFMSDNGGLSAVARGGAPHTHNKPLSSGKGSAHEGGIREPMIVKWPGVVQGRTGCDDYLIIEDFFPTLLEMAGIKMNGNIQKIDGISFMPLLKQTEGYPSDRALFWHFPNNWGPTGPGIGSSSTIRKGDWKLIYYHADRSFELFNIAEDIGETKNLVEENPVKLKELAQLLTQYLKLVDAQMPTDKETKQIVEWPDEVFSM